MSQGRLVKLALENAFFFLSFFFSMLGGDRIRKLYFNLSRVNTKGVSCLILGGH